MSSRDRESSAIETTAVEIDSPSSKLSASTVVTESSTRSPGGSSDLSRVGSTLEYLGRDPVTPEDGFRVDKESVSTWALSALGRLKPQLPLLPWLPLAGNEGWRDLLLGDAFGGLTAGFLLIPQGMAYALIVGVPPVYGLYAGFLPTIVYACFGSSGQASIGPGALIAVLANVAVEGVVGKYDADPERYVGAMALLAFQTGFLQVAFGTLGMGVLTSVLSHPVIEGFTMAGALIIFSKQIGLVFGIEASDPNFFGVLVKAAQNLGDSKWQTVLYSFITIAFLLAVRKYKRSNLPYAKSKQMKLFPFILVAVMVSVLTSYLWPSDGVEIVGTIPEGLPSFIAPDFLSPDFSGLLVNAFVIAILSFVSSFSVASKFSIVLGYELDGNKEFMGLGWANLIPAFFQSFPITASLSRTAVVGEAGGRSTGQGLWTALVMLVTLTVLTPIFKFIPTPVLGGIVMVAISKLIQPAVLTHLWKTSKPDFLVMAVTTIMILALGITIGICIGIGFSFFVLIAQSLFERVEPLAKHRSGDVYERIRGSDKLGDLQEIIGVGIFQLEGVFHFANVSRVRDTLFEYERRYRNHEQYRVHALVVDMAGVSRLDQTTAHGLYSAKHQLEEMDIDHPVRLRLANVRPHVQHVIDHEQFFTPDIDKRAPHERHFSSVHEATCAMLKLHEEERAELELSMTSDSLSSGDFGTRATGSIEETSVRVTVKGSDVELVDMNTASSSANGDDEDDGDLPPKRYPSAFSVLQKPKAKKQPRMSEPYLTASNLPRHSRSLENVPTFAQGVLQKSTASSPAHSPRPSGSLAGPVRRTTRHRRTYSHSVSRTATVTEEAIYSTFAGAYSVISENRPASSGNSKPTNEEADRHFAPGGALESRDSYSEDAADLKV